MIRTMRNISLFVLIAFTFSTLFQVVHIGYADHHPPTREEFNDLVEENKEIKKELEEIKNPERDIWGVGKDLIFTFGGAATAIAGLGEIGAGGVTTITIFGAPIGIPTVALGVTKVGVGTTGIAVSGGNVVKDIGNVAHSVGNFVGDVADKVTDAAANAFREVMNW